MRTGFRNILPKPPQNSLCIGIIVKAERKKKECWQPFFPVSPFRGMLKGARGGIFMHMQMMSTWCPPTHLGADDDAVAYFSCFVGWTGITSARGPHWMSHKSMEHIFIAHKCHQCHAVFPLFILPRFPFFGMCSALLNTLDGFLVFKIYRISSYVSGCCTITLKM